MIDPSGETALLPVGFEPLTAFVPTWAIDGTAARAQQRLASLRAEREAFFVVARDHQRAALELLDRKPLGTHDEREQRLLNLMLSFAHVAVATEVQGPDEEKHRDASRHLIITRSVADE
jgi:hypothetical protein